MAPLVALVAGVVLIAFVPRPARWAVVVSLVAVEAALVAQALGSGLALTAATGVAAGLAGLLVREIVETVRLLEHPAPQDAQERERRLRQEMRDWEEWDRENRRHERERRRGRLAA